MKVIIAGGRNVFLTDKNKAFLDTLTDVIDEIVSGHAKGIDTDAELYAETRQIPLAVFPANWEKHKKAAGYIRNAEMAEYADALVFFEGGRGTENMKNTAIKKGMVVWDGVNETRIQ